MPNDSPTREQLLHAIEAIRDFREETTGVRPTLEEVLDMSWQDIGAIDAEMQAVIAAQQAAADLLAESLVDLDNAGIRQGETFGDFTARGGRLPDSVLAAVRLIAVDDD